MAALVLLSQYKMKKSKRSAPPKESEIAVDMQTMRAFRHEVLSRSSATDAKIDALALEMAASRADMTAMRAEMDAKFHRIIMLHEEQNLRNKQSYDSAAITYEALEDLKRRIKPECLKS